jgi:hypothetical protein
LNHLFEDHIVNASHFWIGEGRSVGPMPGPDQNAAARSVGEAALVEAWS